MALTDYPPAYVNELKAWADQYMQASGYTVEIFDVNLEWMASHNVESYADFAREKWGGLTDAQRQQSPWLVTGLGKDAWTSAVNQYSEVFEQLTGRPLNTAYEVGQGPAPGSRQKRVSTPGNPDFDLFSQYLGQGLTSSEFNQKLMHDKAFQDTYGWVKYGMNYDQFQQQKLNMRQSFGKDLSDQEAVTQLQYLHSNSTAAEARGATAQAKPEGQGQSVVR